MRLTVLHLVGDTVREESHTFARITYHRLPQSGLSVTLWHDDGTVAEDIVYDHVYHVRRIHLVDPSQDS